MFFYNIEILCMCMESLVMTYKVFLVVCVHISIGAVVFVCESSYPIGPVLKAGQSLCVRVVTPSSQFSRLGSLCV